MRRSRCFLGCVRFTIPTSNPRLPDWIHSRRSIAGRLLCMLRSNGWGSSASQQAVSPEEAEAFRKAVATLISMYKQHISVEDGLVFPLAARLLSQTDKAAIANEMATRRKVRLVTGIPHI